MRFFFRNFHSLLTTIHVLSALSSLNFYKLVSWYINMPEYKCKLWSFCWFCCFSGFLRVYLYRYTVVSLYYELSLIRIFPKISRYFLNSSAFFVDYIDFVDNIWCRISPHLHFLYIAKNQFQLCMEETNCSLLRLNF